MIRKAQPNLPGYLQTTHDLRDPRLSQHQQHQKQYVTQAGVQIVAVQSSGTLSLQPQQLGGVPAFNQAAVMAANAQQQYATSGGRMALSAQQGQPHVLQPAWGAAGAVQSVATTQGYFQQMNATTSGQLQLRPVQAAGAPQGKLMTATVHSPAGAAFQQQAGGMLQLQPMQQQAPSLQLKQQQQLAQPRPMQQQHQPSKQGAGQQGAGASGAGPRPMKRQAYQGLQSSMPKRPQYSMNRYTPGSGVDAARGSTCAATEAATGEDTDIAKGGGRAGNPAAAPGAAAARPRGVLALQGMRCADKQPPGEVQMLADAQELMCTIMQYMVKHRQFSSAVQGYGGQQQVVNGYDLCRFKQDFMDRFKYELVHTHVGHAKVKELIVWLMMDAVEVRTTGTGGSHMVLYPLPDVDYSKFKHLDCGRLLDYFANHTDAQLIAKLPSIRQQIEQYQEKVVCENAAAEANGAAAAAAYSSTAATAADTATVKDANLFHRSQDASDFGLALVRGEPGLDLPLTPEQVSQQQQLPPKQQLAKYLRRQLIEVRVTARRTAVAEAWTNSYMNLDEQVDSILSAQQGGPHAGHFKQIRQVAQADEADNGGAAAAAANGVSVKDEESSLLMGLDDETGDAAVPAAAGQAAAAVATVTQVEEEDLLLQGLEQDAVSAGGSQALGGQQQQQRDDKAPPAHASFTAAPGVRVKAAGPLGGGDSKYQAGLAIRAKELLQQWPLQLDALLAGFAAESPGAHQQLMKVLEATGTTFADVVQELITDSQAPLCATLTDPAAATAAEAVGSEDKQQGHQELRQHEKLWPTEPNSPDVSHVIQLHEQVAALLLDSMPKVPRTLRFLEVGLYDAPGIAARPGLASQLLRNWPALQLHHIQELGVASLEELLDQQVLFGRLLTIRRVDMGDHIRVMVRAVVNPRADLLLLLERRMVQLVGAGLRSAISCCTLPALAGYRLDRLKQDFALEYGYALQQQQMGGSQSFRALMEGFPDYCFYKSHQRNTLIMHPSPVMHLRLLLRLLLAPVVAAVQKMPQGDADAAAGEGDAETAASITASDSSSSNNGKILAAVAASWSNPIMGGVSGFSAPTARYLGCPSASVKPALGLLAAAVEAALVPHHSMAHVDSSGAKVYPVVAVQQAFQTVYGYSLPLYKLGVENFKQLLMELDGECTLTPQHVLSGDTPSNVPEVWYVTPAKAISNAPGEPPKVKTDSAFRELYLKRVAASKALLLVDWEPVPLGAAGVGAAGDGSYAERPAGGGGGHGGSVIPALGGAAARHGNSRGLGGGKYGSGDYAGTNRQQQQQQEYWSGGDLLGGASRTRVMGAVSDLLRRKLATVPSAYDVNGQRNSVPLEAGYRLNSLHNDLKQSTGLTLDIDALGYKNLVQLVGALPDVATIVFSPDRQHRAFPPKPGMAAAAVGAAPTAAAGGGMPGGSLLSAQSGQAVLQQQQPLPPPRPGMGPQQISGFGNGGGGQLGMGNMRMQASQGPLGTAAAGVDLGGSLGLGTQLGFNSMGQQQQQQQQQLAQWQAQQQQQQLHYQQQQQLQQQQQQQSQQQQQLQQQQHHHQQQQPAAQQAAKIHQTAQTVSAVAEAASKLGMSPGSVSSETLAMLVSAAAAASGQQLSAESMQLATAALRTIFSQHAGTAAPGQQAAAPAPTPQSTQLPGLAPSAQGNAAAAAAGGGGGGSVIPALGGPAHAAGARVSSAAVMPDTLLPMSAPMQASDAGGSNAAAASSWPGEAQSAAKAELAVASAVAGGQQASGLPSWHGQQQQGLPPGAALWAAGNTAPAKASAQKAQQQQQQQRPALQYAQAQLLPPLGSRPPSAAAQQDSGQAQQGQQGRPGPPYTGTYTGPPGAAGGYARQTQAQQQPPGPYTVPALPGSHSSTAAATAVAAAQQQQQLYYQQPQQPAAAPHAAPAAGQPWPGTVAAAAQPGQPGQQPSQADQEAYMKWYADYQKYLQDMAVYEQQMRQWQQQQAVAVAAASGGAAAAQPPMPPDPPPADANKPAATAATMTAAAPAAASSAGAPPTASSAAAQQQQQQQQQAAYGYNPYHQLYGYDQPGAYGQPAAAAYPPGAYGAAGYPTSAAPGQQQPQHGAYPYAAYPQQQYPYGH